MAQAFLLLYSCYDIRIMHSSISLNITSLQLALTDVPPLSFRRLFYYAEKQQSSFTLKHRICTSITYVSALEVC